MTGQDYITERRNQVEAVRNTAKISPGGRGVLLPGLWAARIAAGLTQRGLAASIGSGQNTVHALENLERGANLSTITKLATTLKVEITDLMCEESRSQKRGGER